MLKLPTSLSCLLGTQPAVAGAGVSLVELEIRIYWVEEGFKLQNKTYLDGKILSVAVKQACKRKHRENQTHENSTRYIELTKEVKINLKSACTNSQD